MKGVRLYPRWHGYALSSASCLELIHRATERRMLVSIPLRVEDARQRSWLVDVPDVPLDELVALVKAVPRGRFHLLNGIGFLGSPLGRKDNGLPENYCIEISRLNVRTQRRARNRSSPTWAPTGWCSARGCPSTIPTRLWPRSTCWRPAAEVKEKILWQNAARWLS